jgi:predicted alpha/beta superfamily hydrolase
MKSASTGELYDVHIYIPRRKAPAAGFPVLYALDGRVLFGGFMDAARYRANAGELSQAIIVGIEGAEVAGGAERTYDFTPADLTKEEKAIVYDVEPNERHGGADRFFAFVESELKPLVAALAPVDPTRSSLVGWSLGGQFVLNALLKHPGSFSTFVALSPSIWWGNRVILDSMPTFLSTIVAQNLRPRVFLGVSSGEGDPDSWYVGDSDPIKVRREAVYTRMEANTIDLAADLRNRDSDHRMTLVSRLYEGRTHNSIPWQALNEVLDFALPPK